MKITMVMMTETPTIRIHPHFIQKEGLEYGQKAVNTERWALIRRS